MSAAATLVESIKTTWPAWRPEDLKVAATAAKMADVFKAQPKIQLGNFRTA